jgi:hypothetical protein
MSTRAKVTFMSINAFKKALGVNSLEVVFYPKTNKLSVLSEDGEFFRCQQSLDTNKAMAFLIEEGKDLADACLVNVSSNGESPLETKAVL